MWLGLPAIHSHTDHVLVSSWRRKPYSLCMRDRDDREHMHAGVVPACGSIDCVSVFCLTVSDGGLLVTVCYFTCPMMFPHCAALASTFLWCC